MSAMDAVKQMMLKDGYEPDSIYKWLNEGGGWERTKATFIEMEQETYGDQDEPTGSYWVATYKTVPIVDIIEFLKAYK